MTAAVLWEPQFDACSSDQEQLALKFCAEIAAWQAEPGVLFDPVRLLDMCESLYVAERDECRPTNAVDTFSAGWEAMRKTAKGAVLDLSLGEDGRSRRGALGRQGAGGAGMNTVFPQLRIEHLENGLIRLEDDSSLDTCVLVVHPLQVRHMAAALGLVREMSASDADTLAAARRQHTDAVRTVLALKRRLLVLKDRIDHVGKSLVAAAEHADLDFELIHLTATAEICDEFCADLDDLVPPDASHVTPTGQAADHSATTSPANPAETQRVSRTESATATPASGQQKDLLA